LSNIDYFYFVYEVGSLEEYPQNGALITDRREINRRNAQCSTGPRTVAGKSRSRRNALKHGILSSVLIIRKGVFTEDGAAFEALLSDLVNDLAPLGTLEEMLVEKIAVCMWRERRALECEVSLSEHALNRQVQGPAQNAIAKLVRYETMNHRQLHAMNQLERLQRARKGEHVPAPIKVEIATDS